MDPSSIGIATFTVGGYRGHGRRFCTGRDHSSCRDNGYHSLARNADNDNRGMGRHKQVDSDRNNRANSRTNMRTDMSMRTDKRRKGKPDMDTQAPPKRQFALPLSPGVG